MVQVLQGPHRKPPSFLQSVVGGLAEGVPGAIQQYHQMQRQSQIMQAENEAAKRMGIDLSGFSDPKQRETVLKTALEGQQKQGLLGQKQNFLNQLFQGQSNQKAPGFNEQIQGSGKQSQLDPADLSDEQIAQATAVDPNLGRALMHAKDVSLRERREERKFEFEKEKLGRHEQTEISKPILQELNQSRKNIPLQEQAILDIQQAAPNVSALDYFADVTGFEPLRTAEGAKLKTGIKDFFLSDLTRVGARPNMWVEQQLADALPKIGRSTEANLITAAGMKFKVDLAKKRIEEIDDLAEKDREKFGYVKADIDSRAAKNMKKYVIDRQKELHDDIKKIKSNQKGKKNTVMMISPEGSTYEIQSDDIDEAIEHGYNFSR